MNVIDEIKETIATDEGSEMESIEYSRKAINNDNEHMIICNCRYLPAYLDILIKKKRIEIRDLQILGTNKYRIWICPTRN